MQTDPTIVKEAWTLVHRCSMLLQHIREQDIVPEELQAVQDAVWQLADCLPREGMAEAIESDTQ